MINPNIKIKLTAFGKKLLKKSLKVVLITLPILCLTYWGTYEINNWFDSHYIEFRSPVQPPMLIHTREPLTTQIQASGKPLWEELNLTGIEKSICIRFGSDCKLALAVAKAENSEHKCDLVNKNKNGSTDTGLFQINTVHFAKYSQRQLMDCETNLNAAWEIYLDSGFNPWVAYLNGSYKKFLIQ